MTSTSPLGPDLDATGPAEVPKLDFDVGAGLLPPSGVPGMGTEAPSSREVSGECTRTSSSSRIEGLNKSCVNTPGGFSSRLNLSRVRASTASLSRQRI
jgi:hypothetical protein